jgi:hypothetical protein
VLGKTRKAWVVHAVSNYGVMQRIKEMGIAKRLCDGGFFFFFSFVGRKVAD